MFDLEYVPENLPALLALTAGVLLLWFSTGRPKGLPPGSRPVWPLIGNLLALGTKHLKRFQEWRGKYGDIFSFYVGQHLIVVLNGYNVLKDALVKHGDDFSYRPKLFLIDLLGVGIVTSNGKAWKEHRRFAVSTLRDFGMGKIMLEEKINEETVAFLKAMEDLQENNTDFTNLVEIAVSNVICSVVFGKKFEYDDPLFISYLKTQKESLGGSSITGAVGLFPFLRYIPGDIFRLNNLKRANTFIDENFFKPAIEEHIKNYDEDDINDFISAYIREIRQRKSLGEETSFSTDTLVRVIGDLFTGGSETTSTTIRWAVIHLIRNPEVQEKCYQEVKEVIGHERLPQMADKLKMPYVEATITEILRLAAVVPFSFFRTVSHDVCLNGHTIPKGAIVIPNLFSVLKDPKVFENPDAVKPERFLDSDGNFVKREEFVPFAIGKRSCPGEALAKMELFLFLTAMIQCFTFEKLENGELPSLESVLGATLCPKPFKFRAIKRHV